MKIEYEIRFLEIDKDKILKKLHELGATEVGDWLQIRKTYNFVTPRPNAWLRLRTNGIKTTLTVKEISSDKIDGTKESEVEVSDFAETDEILKKIGIAERNFQENRRHQFLYKGVEIDVDSWPLIPTYLEIEGQGEDIIKEVCKDLDLNYEKSTTMDVVDIYNKVYGIDILNMKELKFK